jgi:predicted MFS family arabinose efflux permease
VMGLVAGPVALIAAYLFTYGLHGTAGPMHMSLLHREAEARNRATVLSINSMVAFAAFALVAPLLGVLADAASTQTAMVTAGAFSVLGAVLYLPAMHAEKARGQAVPEEVSPAPGS